MKLIGQEEVWENIKKANAIGRARGPGSRARSSGAAGLRRADPGACSSTRFQSLELVDIVAAAARVRQGRRRVRRASSASSSRWGARAGARTCSRSSSRSSRPALMPYMQARPAARSRPSSRNPIAVHRQPGAGPRKQGFQQFAGNFLTHLKAGADRVAHRLAARAIYIPQAFDAARDRQVRPLACSGLTWANIRGKLVKAIGETAVEVAGDGLRHRRDAGHARGRRRPGRRSRSSSPTCKDMVIEQDHRLRPDDDRDRRRSRS